MVSVGAVGCFRLNSQDQPTYAKPLRTPYDTSMVVRCWVKGGLTRGSDSEGYTVGQYPGIMTMDDITLAIAVYGAVVSSFTAYLYWREQTALVDVDFRMGVYKDANDQVTKVRLTTVVRNKGETVVHLQEPYFQAAHGRLSIFDYNLIDTDVDFPYELKPKTKRNVTFGGRRIAKHLRRQGISGTQEIVSVFPDALDNRHKSGPISFPVDGWS